MHESVKPETAALLRKVAAYILEEPKRFNLNFWGSSIDPKRFDNLAEDDDAEEAEEALLAAQPPCGTVACIAGNACIVTGKIEPVLDDQVYHFPGNTAEI